MDHADNMIDTKKAVLISILFHLIIGILFVFWKVGVDLPVADFAEIAFIASSSNDVPITSRTPEYNEPAEQLVNQLIPVPDNTGLVQGDITEPVNLPKLRAMAEDEEMVKREFSKLDPSQKASTTPVDDRIYNNKVNPESISGETGKKRIFVESGESRGSDKPSPAAAQSGSGNLVNQPFTIEGEAANRIIVKQVNPQYPAGLQKEAIVKIRITVLPTGLIGQMLPVQKGDPVLEEITMTALRQWRFNALQDNVLQNNVQGVITFKYELR